MNAPAMPWWERIKIRPRRNHPVAWLRRLAILEVGTAHGSGMAGQQCWQRRVSVVFHRMLEERLGYKLETNVPPPGWTIEEDIREEALALSELTLDRCTRLGGNDD